MNQYNGVLEKLTRMYCKLREIYLPQGSLVTCEFLLQNAGNVNQLDAQGRGPLHHATMLGHTGSVPFTPCASLPHQSATVRSKKYDYLLSVTAKFVCS